MRLWFIYFVMLGDFMALFLFFLEFLAFGHWIVIHHHGVESKLLFSIIEFFQFLGIHAQALWKFLKHLLKFLNLLPKFIFFLSQIPDNLISLALINHSFILNFLSLISIPKRRESLLIVIRSRRNSTNHQSLRVPSQSILQDTSKTRISVRYHSSFSLPHRLIS